MTTPVPKSPRDRYSPFTWAWIIIAAVSCAVEGVAFYQDAQTADRVKRTLSSNARALFAWDSITGQPLDVPWGRLRRTALICLLAWLTEHLKRSGADRRV